MRCRHSFTVWELLCVLIIIGIIAGLLLPAMSSTRSRSVRAVCQSVMRQHSIAMSAYAKDFDSRPPAPDSWLFSAASVSAEHPLGCRWHDAGVSRRRSTSIGAGSRGTLLLYSGIGVYSCPEFRRFAEDRGCESPDHFRSIRIEPQSSYTMSLSRVAA